MDPLRTEYHWRKLYQCGYFRGGPVLTSALSGIDQALWDIKGRHYDAPVYDLLGGYVRDRLMVYQWVGGDEPEEIAESAVRDVEHGYRAIKLNFVGEFRPLETAAAVDRAVRRVAAVRDAVGEEVLIGVDFHGRVSEADGAAELVRRLRPYDPMFVDQPLLPEHADSFGSISDRTAARISTGERFYTRYDFKRAVRRRRRLGHTARRRARRRHQRAPQGRRDGASVRRRRHPHCPLGPVAFAASLQLGFCSQNVVMLEQDLGLHDPESSQGWRSWRTRETFTFENGYVARPEGPGLGIQIDEDYVREQARADVNWYNPVWHHEDGSVAEW